MGLFAVNLDSYNFNNELSIKKDEFNELLNSIEVLQDRLQKENLRFRTIEDYIKWYRRYALFCNVNHIYKLSQLNTNTVYDWLASMDVSDSTKNIRLKSLKSALNRLHDINLIKFNYWKNVKIRVNTKQKHGANDFEVQELLCKLDMSNFFELRDAVAILLMYKTGVRNSTMALVKEQNFDFGEKIVFLDGNIMKNHNKLALPIDQQLSQLVQLLIAQNNIIRAYNNKQNEFIFINRTGDSIHKDGNHSNTIQKRIFRYAKEYNLDNVNPHGLRRGFATNLLKAGANVALISKALGHSSLDVTTRYLDISEKEVIDGVREYMNFK